MYITLIVKFYLNYKLALITNQKFSWRSYLEASAKQVRLKQKWTVIVFLIDPSIIKSRAVLFKAELRGTNFNTVKNFVLVWTNFWSCSTSYHKLVKFSSNIWSCGLTGNTNVEKRFCRLMIAANETPNTASNQLKIFSSVLQVRSIQRNSLHKTLH